MTSAPPLVSVVIPCRNEERHIAGCLDSVIENDYPSGCLEILVINGMSTDGTPGILREYANRVTNLKILDNPGATTPISLNLGARSATGDFVIRMDAHARMDRTYIRRCVETSLESGADNVGGIMKTLPQTEGLVAEAIVACLSHKFGVGGSTFRTGATNRVEVDTVFGGCYRRDVFGRIGYWNESIPRSQDIEFNRRLKRSGGRIVLDPEIVSYYFARSDLRSFLKHNWTNGNWATLPFMYCDEPPVSWRHLVPLAFVLTLGAACILSIFTHVGVAILCAILIAYATACGGASIEVAWRRRDWRFATILPFVFVSLHFAYGLGSAWGLIQVVGRTLQGGRR